MKHCNKILGLCLLSAMIPVHAHVAKAQAVHIVARNNYKISVPGYHVAIIENKTDLPQDYSYQFQTCVDQWRCSKVDDMSGTVHLEPHTSVERTATSMVWGSYPSGTYPIAVTTKIFGETTAEFTAYNSLTIY